MGGKKRISSIERLFSFLQIPIEFEVGYPLEETIARLEGIGKQGQSSTDPVFDVKITQIDEATYRFVVRGGVSIFNGAMLQGVVTRSSTLARTTLRGGIGIQPGIVAIWGIIIIMLLLYSSAVTNAPFGDCISISCIIIPFASLVSFVLFRDRYTLEQVVRNALNGW